MQRVPASSSALVDQVDDRARRAGRQMRHRGYWANSTSAQILRHGQVKIPQREMYRVRRLRDRGVVDQSRPALQAPRSRGDRGPGLGFVGGSAAIAATARPFRPRISRCERLRLVERAGAGAWMTTASAVAGRFRQWRARSAATRSPDDSRSDFPSIACHSVP